MSILDKVLRHGADKDLKRFQGIVAHINDIEPTYQAMSDEQLTGQMALFKERVDRGESLDSILPEAFATVRETAWRELGMRHFDVQLIGGIALHEGMIAEESTGEGKCIPLYINIPTPDGWRKAGDLKVGDRVFGRDGKPTSITGVYRPGKKKMYRITLKDGRQIECSHDHRWCVYKQGQKGGSSSMETVVHDVDYMIEHGIKKGKYYKYRIPVCDAVEYPEKKFSIDPYVMGCFLGDGCKNVNGDFELSSSDEFILDECASLLNAAIYKNHNGTYSYHFYKNNDSKSPLKIKDVDSRYVGLLSKTYCHDKYIPTEYKMGSVDQRFALIQGLFDTDGNIYDGNRANIQYSTTSARLRDDIIEVCNSLGMSATWRLSRTPGTRTAKHDQYTIMVNIDHCDKPKLFRLPRKLEIAEKAARRGHRRRNYYNMPIVAIDPIPDDDDVVCFTVDAPDHLFLVGNYIVTHNTLVATAPVYLNSLTGKGVHLVTVNDYLAKRDSEIMGRVYRRLGMTVGLLQNGMGLPSKQRQYLCDVTYGTNSEFGFDYLRDNMVTDAAKRMQRGHHYCIVDEVDSILIDEARTPLIISGAGSQSGEMFRKFAAAVRGLVEDEDYVKDELRKQVAPLESGITKVEAKVGCGPIYDDPSGLLPNYLQNALKAEYMFKKDVDYMVADGEVKIVDEFTGRVMKGRRWSDGLHQAVEAKEGVEVKDENQTLASVTLQNYFRLYDKLAGMTGTGATEDAEFLHTYHIGVQVVPTNKPVIRDDMKDVVYMTADAKFKAVVEDVVERHKKGQPVLVGTTSVETSERVSKMLSRRGVKHEVLNAKNHAREAGIVAQAGRKGAVTVATNMAGRGTDIMLGGNPEGIARQYLMSQGVAWEDADEAVRADAIGRAKLICSMEKEEVKALGGLAIVGTERHESRRIDNQLRGRSGRQGDPGCSRFYLSLDDDVMRLFGGDKMDRVKKFMEKAKLDEDTPLEAAMLSRAIENAQRTVEDRNYMARKHLLEYDDVMDKQRKVIYAERDAVLDGKDIASKVESIIDDVVSDGVAEYINQNAEPDEYDMDGLAGWLSELTGIDRKWLGLEAVAEKSPDEITAGVRKYVGDVYAKKMQVLGDQADDVERKIMLRVIDARWMAYIVELDYIKGGIGLRGGIGGRDALTEYKQEAYSAFGMLVKAIYEDFLRGLLRIGEGGATNALKPTRPAQATFVLTRPSEADGDHSKNGNVHVETLQPEDRIPIARAAEAASTGKLTFKSPLVPKEPVLRIAEKVAEAERRRAAGERIDVDG